MTERINWQGQWLFPIPPDDQPAWMDGHYTALPIPTKWVSFSRWHKQKAAFEKPYPRSVMRLFDFKLQSLDYNSRIIVARLSCTCSSSACVVHKCTSIDCVVATCACQLI